MKVILYGRKLKKEHQSFIQEMVSTIEKFGMEFCVHAQYFEIIKDDVAFASKPEIFPMDAELSAFKVDAVISLGGDGTLLNTLTFIKDSGVPVLGVNLGRLGFLSGATRTKGIQALEALKDGNYHVEQRLLLKLDAEPEVFASCPYALNEFSIYRQDSSSMLEIKVRVNGQFLATYFADGIILATPTGSTGYSISCGGPVVHPNTDSLIVTPVAPHNLNVRPVVIPSDSIVEFEVDGREDHWNCTLDSRHQSVGKGYSLKLSKANFSMQLIRIEEDDFFETLTTKLLWGQDPRS